jgi:hypothetical protein
MTAPAASRQPHLAAPDANPSFTKAVFLGELREDLVFPFPTLDPQERESLALILDSLRAFAEEHVDSARFDHEGKFPDATLKALHELGVVALVLAAAIVQIYEASRREPGSRQGQNERAQPRARVSWVLR